MITYPTDQLILINLVNQLIGAAPHYLRLPHKRFLKHFTQAHSLRLISSSILSEVP